MRLALFFPMKVSVSLTNGLFHISGKYQPFSNTSHSLLRPIIRRDDSMLTLICMGFLMVRFALGRGGRGLHPCLKLVRIMLET